MSNRLTLDQLRNLRIGEILELPMEQIADLFDDLKAEKEKISQAQEWLNSAMTLRFSQRADDMLKRERKTHGTIHLREGDFDIEVNTPKTVEWNQEALAASAESIAESGGSVRDWMDVKYSIPESKWKLFDDKTQQWFLPARTVKSGKPTYKISATKALNSSAA